MAATGTLGSRVYVSSATVAATIDTVEEYTALSWIEIGLIESVGEFGRVFDLATFQAIKEGRMYKLKAGFNDGALQLVVGEDLGDAGQVALKGFAEASNQNNYGFRVELNDAPTAGGGPTTYFFRGLPMSFRTTMGAVNNVIKATANVEVNSDILQTDPADIYDRFVAGGTLTDSYALFHGSDAQALDPALSADTLVEVTGNDGTSFATDGSQAISLDAFHIADGVMVVEARIKISAITNAGFFFGLTDQTAALEMPIEASGTTDGITTNATDAVGFMFDTKMATDNLWLVGVNNNVDETAQNAGVAPVADTYATYRIELAANGDANFFRNGVAIGSAMTTACRTSVNLFATICAVARSTASRTLTADYLYVSQDT